MVERWSGKLGVYLLRCQNLSERLYYMISVCYLSTSIISIFKVSLYWIMFIWNVDVVYSIIFTFSNLSFVAIRESFFYSQWMSMLSVQIFCPLGTCISRCVIMKDAKIESHSWIQNSIIGRKSTVGKWVGIDKR